MKVRQLFAKNAIRHDHAPAAEHLFIVSDDGKVYERFSDQPPGEWSEVPLPKLTYNTSRKVRKK